ncbi:MAG: tripartite tricarboxylate transporter substrate binding protein [Desulfovibrio sp.]|jgi:tripartite-type tricarboxylate transporter receptor subunit TctC|nr:tripartite tricarboxylate transporter substrate binding protein [Desulfovibrio sp.]
MKKGMSVCAAFLFTFLFAAPSFAGEYPERVINLVIAYPPGGGSDILLNGVKPFLEKELKQSLIPVYKPGANGAVGWTYLVKEAPKDGYTICISNSPSIIGNPVVSPETGYTVENIAPIYNIVEDPAVLIVKKDSLFKNLKDFIDHVKANPGKVQMAHSGYTDDGWITTRYLEKAAGISFVMVPFVGDSKAAQSVMGGHIDANISNVGIMFQQIKDGSVKALAVFSDKRSPYLPDIPTAKEAGYDIQMGSARGFSAAKGVPEEILAKLEMAFTAATSASGFKEKMDSLALPLRLMNRKEYQEYYNKHSQAFKILWVEQQRK